jgi:hypothetical protein
VTHTEIAIRILFFAIGLVPAVLIGEFTAAIFSPRVRRYIASHPVAHLILLCFAVFYIVLLVPASSGPHHRF